MRFEKKVFEELDTKITEAATLLEKLKQGRKTLSDICEHVWVDDGSDSHYNWEKCAICGETRNV